MFLFLFEWRKTEQENFEQYIWRSMYNAVAVSFFFLLFVHSLFLNNEWHEDNYAWFFVIKKENDDNWFCITYRTLGFLCLFFINEKHKGIETREQHKRKNNRCTKRKKRMTDMQTDRQKKVNSWIQLDDSWCLTTNYRLRGRRMSEKR